MPVSAALVLSLTCAAASLASPAQVARMLDTLQGGEVVLVADPLVARPVRVLAASRVAAPVEKVRAALAVAATYPAAIPSLRKVEPLAPQPVPVGAPQSLAWELEVPMWNLEGKLQLHARADGAELVLFDGDLSPGRFSLAAHADGPDRSLLVIEAHANVKDANWVVRKITTRSPLGEPAILAAASHVLLRALCVYLEQGRPARASAAMGMAPLQDLHGQKLLEALPGLGVAGPTLAVWIKNRPDGRLAFVSGAFPSTASVAQVEARAPTPAAWKRVLGWKDTTVEKGKLPECRDATARCLVVDSSLPFFDLDATWKIWGGQFRAKAVDENLAGASMALFAAPSGTGSVLVLSQSMGLHRSGYFARKLIAAEPLLEQGLALALALADTISFAKAVEAD